MLPLRIRPPLPEDYPAMADILNTTWTERPVTAQRLRDDDAQRIPGLLAQRLVADWDGQLVGTGFYGHADWSHRPDKYYVDLTVHPDYRGRGIGTAFYDHVLATLAPHAPRTLVAMTNEDKLDAMRFLSKRGFQEVLRELSSRLELATFDPAPFQGRLAEVTGRGIRVLSMAAYAEENPEWRRAWYALECEIEADIPTTDESEPRPFEQFVLWTETPGLSMAGCFIALDGATPIGYTGVRHLPADPSKTTNIVTGVLRPYRRQGIALALKLHAIRYAQSLPGARTLQTYNASTNPMYLLNQRLGFQPLPALLELEKDLTDTHTGDTSLWK